MSVTLYRQKLPIETTATVPRYFAGAALFHISSQKTARMCYRRYDGHIQEGLDEVMVQLLKRRATVAPFASAVQLVDSDPSNARGTSYCDLLGVNPLKPSYLTTLLTFPDGSYVGILLADNRLSLNPSWDFYAFPFLPKTHPECGS